MSETAWQRLDPRMLLVYPVTEIVKYIPVLIGSVIVGTTSGNPLWSSIPVLLVAAFGVLRWFTTTYRIDADHVQLRTGIVGRRTLSVPRPRIRSVDVEADLLHRVLGLAVLTIGTGTDAAKDEEFKLDALDTSRIPALRTELLSHTTRFDEQPTGDLAPTPESGVEIGHWRAAWVRYAPLSLTGLAIVAPIAGLAAQYGVLEWIVKSDPVQGIGHDSVAAIAVVIAAMIVLTLLLVSFAACGQYLATWYGLRVLDNGSTLHLRHGLFTTRQITLDLARFRGATLNDPLLLRAAGAAQLEMIMTGENSRQKVLPQAPRAAVERTFDELLRTHRRPKDIDSSAFEKTWAPASAAETGIAQHEQTGIAAPEQTGIAAPEQTGTTQHEHTGNVPPEQTGTTQHEHTGNVPPEQTDIAPPEQGGLVRPGQGGTAAAVDAPDAEHRTSGGEELTTTRSPLKLSAVQSISGTTLGTIGLIPHGRAARRRRYVRAAWPVGILLVAMIVSAALESPLPAWIWVVPVLFAALMAALAEDRYRSLGHRVLPADNGPTWLITRRGSLDRNRDCLEAPGIIGWTIRQTFWQRRSGLATVVAATAAGKKAYLVVDIPHDDAVALIDAVTPGLLGSR
ncbi:PH domain-containing protein [Nocardia caishijiensis]|uniref:PH (Pleckstrin Homology) domain-containing protein n=1 Tax=Nocardia caishijiensis TaxID=184756 RepID=A0ABQ6YK04_9NOCA|nr:PH domain-containing protein [Nocardia caishijiensis]KAF0846127.1 PH (Pleckstrin Homology) domain-containing protein [Nocardia caishijiensis]